ncbi:hypothetical protein N7476_004440 [Penicillium atrosanguineum]|uniref:FAD/NAD(P)-binding domain-containing protein n=1 Tax=Penicillium atrosanguineum TaxID=1132637 RepID=A0A9W9Q2B4_9EURO|nr:hypothetical protein N7476_004440 [Penicillium atrosanguineum]
MAPTPTPTKNILILGASYAGVSTAHYLLKHAIPKLPDPESYKIVLVSPSTEILCRPACPRPMISDDLLPQDKLFVSIPEVFKKYSEENFRFEHATALELDHAGRKVLVKSTDQVEKTIEYHALVIATGASTPSPLLGLNSGADTLRAEWVEFRTEMSRAKSIVIAGGGPAGIETAGELGEHLNGTSGWFCGKLENPKVQITVVTSSSQILPGLRSSIAKKAEGLLARMGVVVVKGTKVVDVQPPSEEKDTTAITLSDGSVLEADIYIPAVGTTPNTSFIDKSLLIADGRVNVTNALRVEGAGERVYAVGDVASNARPAVHAILSAVPVLCANVKRDLLLASGVDVSGADRLFIEDTRETQLVPIGRRWGVGAAMGWQIPSFMVWLIKGRDYWLWTTGGLWSGSQWDKES